MKLVKYILLIPFRVIFTPFIPFFAIWMAMEYPELSYIGHCMEGLEFTWEY